MKSDRRFRDGRTLKTGTQQALFAHHSDIAGGVADGFGSLLRGSTEHGEGQCSEQRAVKSESNQTADHCRVQQP